MGIENPQNKIEKVNEFTIPSSEIIIDTEFIKDMHERLRCRFDGEEFKKIIGSLSGEKIKLPQNQYSVYDKLENFNDSVLNVLFAQGIEEMEYQSKEKILRNIKYFVENSVGNKILLTNNQYTHLGFYANQESNELYEILCQRHNDSDEWLFWLTNSAAKTNSTHRAIVETIEKK